MTGVAPERLASGDATYVRDPRLAAVPAHDAREPLLVLEDEGLAVVAVPPGARGRPVYRQTPGDGLVVPTGRAFVRFAEGDTAAAHGDALAAAGWTTDQVPGWAPNTAWLRAADGDVAAALARLERLRGVPGVEHVEPELLRARVRRRR